MGLALPAKAPWTDITFVGTYWHETERLPALLELAGKWFTHAVIGVQADEIDDKTMLLAHDWVGEDTANRILIPDRVHGYAEPTLYKAVLAAQTPWSLVISGDESPDESLLTTFDELIAMPNDGFWIPFLSSIEGTTYASEQDQHLRLFKTNLGWPATMHSRPPAIAQHFLGRENGVIHHDRSLSEMMEDYLRYYASSFGNTDWEVHNRLMMHDACAATARKKGWDFVRDHPWWAEVDKAAFVGCRTACTMRGTGYNCHE